ncbi:hypothetical protein AIK90_24375, partial [Salmonella enterica subsp. enterica serovar Newport str. CFSAN001734]|nr:hypothetical protein [Salmonella enterica subsp. enterica serovar Newport]
LVENKGLLLLPYLASPYLYIYTCKRQGSIYFIYMYVCYIFGIFGMCGIKQKSLIYQGFASFLYSKTAKITFHGLEYFETVRFVYVV